MKTKSTKLSDQDQVTEHIQKLDPALGNIVETLQRVIKEWLKLVEK